MLKEKHTALGVFKNFKAMVEKNTNREIKVFRTDRGGEFTSIEFKTYCEVNGIVRHLTAHT